MAWYQEGDKPLSWLIVMMAYFTDAYMSHLACLASEKRGCMDIYVPARSSFNYSVLDDYNPEVA